jgi:hypothetical protein
VARSIRLIAIWYSVVFGCAALWAWSCYFFHLGSPREHLLPGIILNLISMPLALIIGRLVVWLPVLLNSEVLFLCATSLCGLIQVAGLWGITSLSLKRRDVRTTLS